MPKTAATEGSGEARFSVNFRAYNGIGVDMLFTIRGYTPEEFYANLNEFFNRNQLMGGVGILQRTPPEGSVLPKEQRVTGWLRGDSKSNKGGTLPCVYFYAPGTPLEYAFVVYQENLWLLPPSINWENQPSIGVAPPRASDLRIPLIPCDLTIIEAPVRDRQTNEVVMNKNGNPKYRFQGVKGYTPEHPLFGNDEASPSPTSAPKGPNGAAPAPATTDKINGGTGMPCPVCHAPPGRMHATNCTYVPADEAPAPPMPAAPPMASTNFNLAVSPATQQFIARIRNLDATSPGRLTVTGPGPDGKPKTGQYNWLVGVINKVGIALGNDATDNEWHKEFLKYLLGRPVSSADLPGNNTSVLLGELYANDATKYQKATADAFDEIGRAVMTIRINAVSVATADDIPPF